ncbi:MAG: M48 family metallopeptidase [Anaerolineae bacterium]
MDSESAAAPVSGRALDQGRQEKARAYARIRRRLLLVDLALGATYGVVLLVGGLAAALSEAVSTFSPWMQVAAAFAVLSSGYAILMLPLARYRGFVLPHRYGLSTQTQGAWLRDRLKAGVLALLLGMTVVEVIYLLLRAAPDVWWLWAGVFLLFYTAVLTNLSPILIIPLFYALTPVPDRALEERLTELAKRVGTRVRGVFTIDLSRRTTAANAALVGLANTRRIVLGDTLYQNYTPDEIETILAHELGHHVHRDIAKGLLAQSALTLLGLYAVHLALSWGASRLGLEGPADVAGMPLLGLLLGGFSLVTTPLVNGYSRSRERAADRFALEVTSKPRAFISAMTKLANQNLADAEPEPWVEWLLYSHPAIAKRIAMGQTYLIGAGERSAPAEREAERAPVEPTEDG